MKNIIKVVGARSSFLILLKNIITRVVSLCLLFATLFVSCSKSSGSVGSGGGGTNNGGGGATNSVSIVNMSFTAASITVKAGSTVTWKNNDNMAHTVTANDASFDSGNLATGSSFSRTFSTAGTYLYHCSYHSSMTGTVIVN